MLPDPFPLHELMKLLSFKIDDHKCDARRALERIVGFKTS
jgi:hypothetical protein